VEPAVEVVKDSVSLPRQGRFWRPNLAVLGYLTAAAVLFVGWKLRDQNLSRADDGLGYAMGITGSVLMLLLLIYPLRKRLRGLQSLGSVKVWFQTHMIFGVLGPVLVLLHSNFKLGSFNSRIALFCTLIVAGSGIIGRYLYAKIHHGMHGHRMTLDEMRIGHNQAVGGSSLLAGIFDQINQRLAVAEARVVQASSGLLSSFALALGARVTSWRLKRALKRDLQQALDAACQSSATVGAHRERLWANSVNYLDKRLVALRKYSQLSAFERLFGLWHVVHFPLFIVMVLAAILHVIAVHAY
jgi:hypothetical protein